MNTIQIDDISTLSIQVTEEIESKHLHAFLKTSILSDNSNISKHTYYYFFYNKNSKMYEILYFDNLSNSRLELFDIVEKFNNNDNIVKVLISDAYFILCKNDKIIALKKTNDVKIEEVKFYIEQMYKITEFEFIVLTQKDKELLENKSKNSLYNHCYNLYNKKSFYIFCSFFIITFILFVIMIYFNFYQNNKILNTSENRVVSSKTAHISISKKVTTLFNSIKDNNIIIEEVSYDNNEVETILYHHEKSVLLLFTTKYHKKIDIKSLKYNEQKQMYQMEVSFGY